MLTGSVLWIIQVLKKKKSLGEEEKKLEFKGHSKCLLIPETGLVTQDTLFCTGAEGDRDWMWQEGRVSHSDMVPSRNLQPPVRFSSTFSGGRGETVHSWEERGCQCMVRRMGG